MNDLSLRDRVLMLLYLEQIGLPPSHEGEGRGETQERFFAGVLGCTREEVKSALAQCSHDGFAEGPKQ